MSVVAGVGRRVVAGLVAVALLLFGGAAAHAGEVDALLETLAAAYAPAGTDRGVRAIRQTGVTYSSRREGEGALLRAYAHPDRLLVRIDYGQETEVRILYGAHAWKQDQPGGGAFHGAMRLQAARMALPWNLIEARDRVRDLGWAGQAGGGRLRILQLPLGDGIALDVGVDPESGRILRSVGRLAGSRGVMEFGTVYEDFRHQDGRLYAATEWHFAQGQPSGHTRIDRVEFPDSLPEDLFVPTSPPETRLSI